jgi:hypothetical protein
MDSIIEAIEALSDDVKPIREKALRYAKYSSKLDDSGALLIGHRPWVAELNYMMWLYPGAESGDIDKYCGMHQIAIPGMYRSFLNVMNGAHCFGMSLCGLPASMRKNPPGLDRTVLQCHDLSLACKDWAKEYDYSEGLFHFGSRHFTEDENVGYFIDEGDHILCMRKNGERFANWGNIRDFLSDELAASEKLEEESEPSQWND